VQRTRQSILSAGRLMLAAMGASSCCSCSVSSLWQLCWFGDTPIRRLVHDRTVTSAAPKDSKATRTDSPSYP
jgi:hypothetical protein